MSAVAGHRGRPLAAVLWQRRFWLAAAVLFLLWLSLTLAGL